MMYTVGEMAKLLDIPPSTLRYYDKKGLLPFIERSHGGARIFRESDYEWLQIIVYMKKTGMSLKDIKTYVHLAMQGDETIEQRLTLFRAHRETVAKQMGELQTIKKTLDYKCWYYEQAQKAGTTERLHHMSLEEIPEAYRAARCHLRRLTEHRDDET